MCVCVCLSFNKSTDALVLLAKFSDSVILETTTLPLWSNMVRTSDMYLYLN